MKKTFVATATSVFYASIFFVFIAGACFAADAKQPAAQDQDEEGWISLFDGKTLDGWKVGENPDGFKVKDGVIVVHGPRAHLFYAGPVKNHDFKDFEFKADVMSFPKANSGIYFHTRYQEENWPDWGYEVQVNHSHADYKKSGGLYDVKDLTESPARDNVWQTYHITVRGKRITVEIAGEKVVDFTEPDDFTPPKTHPLRKLAHGTFALQAHDPGSQVLYKNIKVKPLD
jgi:hypothetical protein